MDRLPPEIISKIVSRVEHQKDQALTPLSLVCRRWQPIVEERIYRKLHLSYLSPAERPWRKSIRDPSHKKLANNLTPSRLSYIRHLHVVIMRFDRGSPTSPTKIIRQLFDLLTQVPHTQEPLLNLRFELRGSFSDFFEANSQSNEGVEFPPDGLPELPMVRSFELDRDTTMPGLSPRMPLYMASKMPRLRELEVTTPDFESIHERVELARSLTGLPTSIHSFFVQYYQDYGQEGLLVPENGEDILTRELRRFSQRQGLKQFLFIGHAELSIFWPPDSAASEPRHWPTLEAFQIEFDRPQHLADLHATESLDDAQDANDSDRSEVHKGIMNASF